MSKLPTSAAYQQPMPVQPVEKPILRSPYVEPTRHWVYGIDGQAYIVEGRRSASYWFKTQLLPVGGRRNGHLPQRNPVGRTKAAPRWMNWQRFSIDRGYAQSTG
jgi:hypothetical protein